MAEDTMHWYVLSVRSGFEKRVADLLRERIRVEHREDDFGEIVIPTEEVVEMRGGQKKTTERKFFPGYILIMMKMNDQTWHLVKSINVATRYVLGFVGGDKPTPITNEEAERILARVREGVEKPRPKTLFEPGEVVRVIEGPFADFNGVVEDVNYEKSRLKVSVLIFGRSTPVELEFSQVEKS
jgi:transcription termination/antitermination protein NusG